MAKLLLKLGAQIDGSSMRAAGQGRNPEIIKTLEAHIGTAERLKWRFYRALWRVVFMGN
jgi:hypothetical protein